jgi:hypothetical protein
MGPAALRIVRLTDDVAVACGSDDEVLGVELLSPRRVLGGGGTPVVGPQNLVGRATGH